MTDYLIDSAPELSSGVTVIVPTTAQASRRMAIRRCIDSIRSSSRSPIAIIVVVNGSRSDPEVCAWLKAQPDVRFEYSPTPSAPNAVEIGRRLVNTAYFSTLDDDDEYLADATDIKMAILEQSPDTDLVVTNALRLCEDQETLLYQHLERVPIAPLATLFESNWLHNGNALFRTSTFHASYFNNYRPYAEWTWLAYKAVLAGVRVKTILQPTFRVNVTAGSLSQSEAYVDNYLPLYRDMLALSPPPAIALMIKTKMSAAWHLQSCRELTRGERGAALLSHLRSMALPGGLRYLSYSARLIIGHAKSRR